MKGYNKFTELKGIVGHILDLTNMILGKNPVPHSYTKFRLINNLRKQTGAKTFVETGTFHGLTAHRASKVFEEVFTIELDEDLAKKATSKFKSNSKISVIQGDAIYELEKVIKLPKINSAVVFLDAHFSGGITASGEIAEPAIKEIEILAQYKHKIEGIIIDDFRLFGSEKGYPKETPQKSQLLDSIERFFNLKEQYDLDIIWDAVVLRRRD